MQRATTQLYMRLLSRVSAMDLSGDAPIRTLVIAVRAKHAFIFSTTTDTLRSAEAPPKL